MSVIKSAMGKSIASAPVQPVKATWLGFPDAAASFVQNAGWFASRKPGSPLRVLSLMAISAALRARGITMDDNRKRAVIETMELGAHLNDRLDGDPHQPADLRTCSSTFSRTFQRDCICNYIKRLRFLERSRPGPDADIHSVKTYRENVNHVSLATLWAIASQRPLNMAEKEIRQETDLFILFRIVMITQIIDDLLDIKKDRHRGLPSFATAVGTSSSALRSILDSYRHPAPMVRDQHFCHHLLLHLAAKTASALITCRRATGWNG
jgi:hypothetical protein